MTMKFKQTFGCFSVIISALAVGATAIRIPARDRDSPSQLSVAMDPDRYLGPKTPRARATIPVVTTVDWRRYLDELEEAEDRDSNSTSPDQNSSAPVIAKEREPSYIGLEQQEALWLLYSSTRMSSSKSSHKHDWFGADHELEDGYFDCCSFKGIKCKFLDKEENHEETASLPIGQRMNSVVEKIDLKDKGLSGSLPGDIFASLPQLASLNLASNEIKGTIPPSLTSLERLRDLDLSHNRFSGSFPSFNEASNTVRRVMLQYNKLKGRIPSKSMCPFEKLKAFDVSGNTGIYGTIPSCFKDFSDLTLFKFDDIGLTGTIPTALCSPDRQMNGISGFGCDAIACPAGTFEATKGRQRDELTPCKPCAYWADDQDDPSSLLLGSRTCPESTEPTIQPSRRPTPSPTKQTKSPTHEPTPFPSLSETTANPTWSPSVLASDTPTIEGPTLAEAPTSSQPSSHVHSVPSSIPSVEPTAVSQSSTWRNDTLSIELVLLNTYDKLQDSQVAVMEKLFKAFFQNQVEQTGTEGVISVVTLTNQSQKPAATSHRNQVSLLNQPHTTRKLRALSPRNQASLLNPSSLERYNPALQRSSSRSTQHGDESSRDQIWLLEPPIFEGLPESSEQSPFLFLRKLRDLESASLILVLTMEVVLSHPTSWNQDLGGLVASWDEDVDDLVELVKSSQLDSIFEVPIDQEGDSDAPTNLEGKAALPSSSAPNWTLLHTALILAVVSVLLASFIAFSRWWQIHRHEGYKQQEDPPQIGSSSTSTSQSNKKFGETSSDPEDDMLLEALDARSAFSCWKNWDTLKCVVSEESESGWNSGSGSGSVPDSYMNGDAAAGKGGLLEQYAKDDVWSVAPDHPLCFSNGTIEDDEDDEGDELAPRRINSADSIIVIATKDKRSVQSAIKAATSF